MRWIVLIMAIILLCVGFWGCDLNNRGTGPDGTWSDYWGVLLCSGLLMALLFVGLTVSATADNISSRARLIIHALLFACAVIILWLAVKLNLLSAADRCYATCYVPASYELMRLDEIDRSTVTEARLAALKKFREDGIISEEAYKKIGDP